MTQNLSTSDAAVLNPTSPLDNQVMGKRSNYSSRSMLERAPRAATFQAPVVDEAIFQRRIVQRRRFVIATGKERFVVLTEIASRFSIARRRILRGSSKIFLETPRRLRSISSRRKYPVLRQISASTYRLLPDTHTQIRSRRIPM